MDIASIALAALLAAALPGSDEPKAASGGPDPQRTTFHEHLLPILKERCLGCHSGDRPKGRLSMSTLEELRAGGKRGAPVAPGKPDESLIYQLVTAQKKPSMPPEKEGPLRAEEIAVIRAWILGGCRAGEAAREAAPYSQPLEPPVYPRPPVVRALIWSPDGALLYVAGYREVLVHRLEEPARSHGYPEARLVGESDQLNALQLSPDGRTLAAAGGSPARFGEVQFWDTAERRLIRFIRVGKDTLFAVSFTASGDRLAAAGADRALHVFSFADGRELYAAEPHSDWVLGVAFSDGDGRLVSAGRDKTIKVSAAQSGEFLKNLDNPGAAPILRVVPRPGTAQFLAGGDARRPVLFDAKEMKQVREIEAQPGAILAAAFSADGKLLALGGASAEVRVYEADSGARKTALKLPVDWIYALAFRPDGERLAVSGYDGIVRLFDPKSGKELGSFPAAPSGKFGRY